MVPMAPSDTRQFSLEEAQGIVARVAACAPKTSRLPSHMRSKSLEFIAKSLEERQQEFADLICQEVAKPMKEARREVQRALFTFRWAAGEAQRFGGEWLPLDLDPNSNDRLALVRRFPRGCCLFITPFNFPLNLVAHKVAPAIAVGVPFVLKPAPQASRTALALGDIIRASGWPEDAFGIVPCSNEVAEKLVQDERFAVLSFTGSAGVGWRLKSIAGKKHVVLELGGNAGVVVAQDADIPWAAARCAWGAYYYSGQVCISVQRIFVEASVYEEFKEYFLKNVQELAVGDPKKETTDIGPMIDERAAQRVESWVSEAVQGGGNILIGGRRQGRSFSPTLVEAPPENCKLVREEAFGPVATLEKVAAVEEGLQKIAKSAYGLQAGLFTRDMRSVLSAWADLPVGGLIVNDIPSYRSDAMPYGGSKLSGTGREGVRYAMEEFTEPRTLVIKP